MCLTGGGEREGSGGSGVGWGSSWEGTRGVEGRV